MPLQLYHLVPPGGPECGVAACDSSEENVHKRFCAGDNYTVEIHAFSTSPQSSFNNTNFTYITLYVEPNAILDQNEPLASSTATLS